MDALSTKTNISKLKRALENLSSDLKILYDDALLRIKSQNQDDRELAEKALRWVAYTHRPLKVRALQEALAINPDEMDLNEEAMTHIGLILDVCAGLLILDKKKRTVRLMHYTAQDYFNTVQSTRFDNVHATIACDCVAYLSYNCIQHPKDLSGHGTKGSAKECSDPEASSDPEESNYFEESSGDTLTSSIKLSFLGYASIYWAQHVKRADRDAHLSTKIHQFLASNPRIMLEKPWRFDDIYDGRNFPTDSLKPHHSLEIAAFFGLCDELKGFHEDIGEVDALTDDLNLLHLAASNNQSSAIQVLLDHGADIERRDRHDLTPLLRAMGSGALEAAETLVNRGADVTAEATYSGDSTMYYNHLTTFSCVQESQSLDLLLGTGANIPTRDIFDKTPLMLWLICTNDLQNAEKLFEQHSVEQPMEKKINSEALIFASRFGTTEMVDMLLRYGADINSDDGLDQTALHLALEKGNIDQVNRLLFCGAEFTPRHLSDAVPLCKAALGGNEDCLLAVLRGGADVNQQVTSGDTALHITSRQGNLAGIKVLLAHGANMEVPSYDGKIALIVAVENGKEDCVLTLLRNGADTNAQNEYGMTPLHIASFAGSLKITHELCKHHATIDTRSTPLMVLKYHRSSHDSLEPELIWYPSFFYTHDDREFQITALEARSFNEPSNLRHILSIRKKLLDIRVWKEGVTALDFAIFGQHDEIVSLLESSAQSVTESDSVGFEEYLYDLLGVSSVKEAKEELKRRIEEERERELRTAEVIERIEEEEESEEDDRPEE